MEIVEKILLSFFGMSWELFWGLALGFIISSLVRAFVSTSTIQDRLGYTNVKTIGMSTFFGAISSSCSYAAASMTRTLLIKGSSWANAVAFLIASTNLVFEIFIVIFALLGFSFFLGELIGGIIFITIAAALFTKLLPEVVKQQAKLKLSTDGVSQHDNHNHSCHHHDMPSMSNPTFKQKLKVASQHFVMDVRMVGKDILIGVIISSILMAVVPKTFWSTLFLTDNAHLPEFIVLLWNALIGAFIAVLSFVCSVGNILLAAVLWHGGISFGGVIAFVLSDLITIPMLQVYRTYFGLKPMLYLFLFLFIGIVLTSLCLDYSFAMFNLIPASPATGLVLPTTPFTLNVGSILNFIFIPISLIYFWYGKKK